MTRAPLRTPAGRSRRRLCLLALLTVTAALTAVSGLVANPALGAGTATWQLTMSHVNPFGHQATVCPSSKPEPTAQPPCGVDPLTETTPSANGEGFSRESGKNRYEITVKNVGGEAAGAGSNVGETLRCLGGPSEDVAAVGGPPRVRGATLAYQWLRNGQAIPGASAETYLTVQADEGHALQCEVTATGSEAASAGVSKASIVGTVTPAPPEGTEAIQPIVKQVGSTKKCEPGAFTGAPAFTYQWLRNGAPIPGATEKEHTLEAKDQGTAIQCQLTATNTGGSVVLVSSPVIAGAGKPALPFATATIPVATVTDILPAGMVFQGSNEDSTHYRGWECFFTTVSVTCATTKALAAGKSYEPIELFVHVTPQAGNPSINTAEVSGGGAGSASNGPGEGETTIYEAAPFGIASFNTMLEDPLGQPFNQAGGHPFGYRTEFTLNYTTTDQVGDLGPAGGAARETLDELPPGFVGNVQNFPQCPMEALTKGKEGTCPENTAVGYAQEVALHGGNAITLGRPQIFSGVEEQKDSGLIYNLQPSAGHPAEFGFVISINGRVPVVIDTNVRSGGDYGVTAKAFGGSSFNLAELQGAKLRFCEYGAKNAPHESGGMPFNSLSCKTSEEAPANAKPFLTNPTACAGPAPLTTLRVNSWNEPDVFAAMEGYGNGPSGPDAASHHPPTRGAPVASSFMNGCQSLQFQPKLEFKPSAPGEVGSSEVGTSQADEPNGIAMNLSVPQSNSASSPGTPALKNLRMTLPAGMTVSPSSADGLQACTKAQFWPAENGGGEPAEHREPAVPADCPQASQIGTAEVFTPLLSGAPALQGKPEAGGEVTCSEGMWSVPKSDRSPPVGSMAYRWLLNGAPAMEEKLGTGAVLATGRTYRLPTGPLAKEDEGKALQCEVTATNAGGSSVAVSHDSVVLAPNSHGEFLETPTPPPFPPPSVPAPTLSPGSTLTCGGEAWSGNPTLAYRWLRGGVQIPGAEESTYKLTGADEGKPIQCQVRATNGHGETIADSGAFVAATVHSTPPPVLPGAPLQGQLFVGQPECSPCTNADAEDGKQLRLFLQLQDRLGAPANDPSAGVIVKLAGETLANATTGRLTTVFENQPQQPFELLQLKLKGGPRAPLANPQSCTTATTSAELTPWSAPGVGGLSGSEPIPGTTGTPPPPSQFNVDWDGAGGPCPGTPPFGPLFNAGTTGPNATAAAASPSFALTFSREDREQDLSGVQVGMPLGLVGKIAAVGQCGEAEIHAAEANSGECPASSELGTATTAAGPGPHPFFTTGKVYLTGPYKNQPFGLAIITRAKAGPFDLGNVVVRSAIHIDEHTSAVTVTSDPLPQFVDGVQLRLRQAHVEVNRPGFLVNPTNCSPQQVNVTLTGLQGTSAQVSSPFGMGGCKNLPFHPELTAQASGQGSKANGTSFTVKVKSSAGQANIGKTFLQLPVALPSRLSTIQKACLAATFEANPASCPEGSNIGMAIAHTPLLKNPLVGPAYLVSHGNAAFPDVEFVLQGEGITLVLDGKTDIKNGITYSRFETVPDAPVDTFETILPAGPHSALTANVPESEHFSLCNTTLLMPTEITGQNGAVIKQTTHIAVTGCAPSVTISSAKVSGNALLVTFKTAGAGIAWASGFGLHTAHEHVTAGTHQIRVSFTKLGMRKHKHHEKTSLRVKLVVGKQAVTRAMTVQL